MSPESDPRATVEYRRTLLGKIPLRKWYPLGKGLYSHTEDVDKAIRTLQPRIILSIQPGDGGVVKVTDSVYNPELKKYEDRLFVFSRHDVNGLNRFLGGGVAPRQFRWNP